MNNEIISTLSPQDLLVLGIKSGKLEYSKFIDLISRHFDVFGLLEAGLALNKLTYLKDENRR